jgi:hypothetical protein
MGDRVVRVGDHRVHWAASSAHSRGRPSRSREAVAPRMQEKVRNAGSGSFGAAGWPEAGMRESRSILLRS